MTPHPPGRNALPRDGRPPEVTVQWRETILDVALRLFLEHGYAKVTLGDITRESGATAATTLAASCDKSSMLRALVHRGIGKPTVVRTLAAARSSADPWHLIAATARGVRVDNERHASTVRMLIEAAATDPAAAETLSRLTHSYRQVLAVVPQRLAELGALRAGIDVRGATDMLWFLLGFRSWSLCVREHGWSWDDTETWLAEQATTALLAGPGTA